MSSPPTPSPSPKPSIPPGEDGNCELLGGPALVVQALMGVMVVLTLVYKRHREKPKRKWRIWTFDVSKQLVGQVVVHFANVFISSLVASEAVQNPCVLYLLNIVVDTTVGVGILYLFLWGSTKILTERFYLNGLETGQYGDGPKPSVEFWARQAGLYVACLLGMKIAVVVLFAAWPGIFDIGEWLLSWTRANETVQVVVVMGVCPILFNMLQFWLIDSIVKAKETLNLGTPMPRAVDDAEAPLFTNEHDTDDEEGASAGGRRRRRASRDLERGVSPLNLSRSTPLGDVEGRMHTEALPPAKKTAATTGHDLVAEPSNAGIITTRRSPPPSPAPGPSGKDPKEEDDWSGWDEPDWEGEAADAWGSKPTTRSPKAAARRTSLSRTRSERSERTSWGMEVINAPGGVR